jgi:hypothetical protein
MANPLCGLSIPVKHNYFFQISFCDFEAQVLHMRGELHEDAQARYDEHRKCERLEPTGISAPLTAFIPAYRYFEKLKDVCTQVFCFRCDFGLP